MAIDVREPFRPGLLADPDTRERADDAYRLVRSRNICLGTIWWA